MPYAAILNSRQAKAPVGGDPWVVSTYAAVEEAVRHGLTIISSVGLNTWELVTWATGRCGGRVLVYVPFPYTQNMDCASADELSIPAMESMLRSEFHLRTEGSEFCFQDPATRRGTKKTRWPERDREIIGMADVLYPISVRSGGNLATLISEIGKTKNFCDTFRTAYQQHRRACIVKPFTCGATAPTGKDAWDYLTHWTRAANGKWPGETYADYYRDVAQSGDRYPRSAMDTLRRILRERLLRASRTHIRGGFPVVSFTSLSPHEAVHLMRWRRRYVRWSFEPYGIGIRKDIAQSLGIRPVIYGIPADYEQLAEPERPFFQNIGMRGGDWAPEKEWRHKGDLDFSNLPDEAVKIIVRDVKEFTRIPLKNNYNIIALGE